MWYVYVLVCVDGSLYTGISSKPDKRFRDHLNGRGGHYTKTHLPIRRVYLEKVGSRSKALKREQHIKGWPREKKIRVLGIELEVKGRK